LQVSLNPNPHPYLRLIDKPVFALWLPVTSPAQDRQTLHATRLKAKSSLIQQSLT